jgi:hypothetical protein
MPSISGSPIISNIIRRNSSSPNQNQGQSVPEKTLGSSVVGAAKGLGKGTIAVGAVGVGVLAATGNAIGKLFRKSSIDTNTGEEQGALKFLLFLAIAIHIVDLWFGVGDRPNTLVLSLYLLLVLMFFIWVQRMEVNNDDMALMIVVVCGMVVPRLMLYFVGESNWPISPYVGGIVILLPFVPLYIWSKINDGGIVARLRTIFWFAWGCLVILILVTNTTVQAQSISSKQLLAKPLQSLDHFGNGIVDTTQNFGKNINTQIKMMISQATGQKYSGDQESQVGLFIDEFGSSTPGYTWYTNSDIYLVAKLRAFNIKDKVTISLKCFVPDSNYTGTLSSSVMTLRNYEETGVNCHMGSLPEGYHTVKLVASFAFATEGWITYYFIDELIPLDALYDEEGKRKADFPSRATATYSGGPVELGLPSVYQPLPISMDPNKKNVGNHEYGISLMNKWTTGKVVRGIKYTLQVPSSIGLYDCTRKMIGPPVTIDDKKTYSFDINSGNLEETFDSVSCRMHVDNPDQLLYQDSSATAFLNYKTFYANATYEYAIEAETTVNVEKSAYS